MVFPRPLGRFVLAAALLATAACSGGGAAPGAAAASDVPAASVSLASPAVPAQALAVSSAGEDITAADITALAAPVTADVAEPIDDATGIFAWGRTLAGDYHGELKGWTNGKEHTGSLRLQISASGHSYTGTGVAKEAGTGDTLSFTLSGAVVRYFPHGETVSMDATDTAGCPASGTAHRWAHVFVGVLKSAGCGAFPVSTTYYFKVRPNV